MSPNLDSENVGAALGGTRRLSREGRLHASYGLAAAGGRPEGVRQVAPQLRTRKGSLTKQQPWAPLLAAGGPSPFIPVQAPTSRIPGASLGNKSSQNQGPATPTETCRAGLRCLLSFLAWARVWVEGGRAGACLCLSIETDDSFTNCGVY